MCIAYLSYFLRLFIRQSALAIIDEVVFYSRLQSAYRYCALSFLVADRTIAKLFARNAQAAILAANQPG